MTREQLARKIYEVSYLRGNFKLRSGQTSTEYFDKYRFEAQPLLLAAIAEQMVGMVPNVDALAGLEMGGIPIATALSLKTGMPACFVRKQAKDYGTCQFAEGFDVKNKKICIIEDVITTGGQVVISAKDLRSLGAEVTQVLCVIDRSGGKNDALKEAGLTMQALFTMEQLKA